MRYAPRQILCAGTLALASGFGTAAMAQQPLDIVVRPVATVIQAPFEIVGGVLGGVAGGPPVAVFDSAAAERRAIGHAADGTPIIRARSLKATGPRYVNPPYADWRDPIVLRRGSTVPARVPTVRVVNASVPGLVPNATYDAFVSNYRNRVVFAEPGTREVARILR